MGPISHNDVAREAGYFAPVGVCQDQTIAVDSCVLCILDLNDATGFET